MSIKLNNTLLWFNTNLRQHDNQLIHWAKTHNANVMGLVVVPKSAKQFRRSFYIQSALELKNEFQKYSIPFLIIQEDENYLNKIYRLVQSFEISNIVIEKAFNFKELVKINTIKSNLTNVNVIEFQDQTLYSLDTLPFVIENLPYVFTHFKKQIQNKIEVSSLVNTQVSDLKGLNFDSSLNFGGEEISFNEVDLQLKFPFEIQPGERAALQKMKQYFLNENVVLNYKETRNGLLNINDSTKLSAHFAVGTLSVRQFYFSLLEFEKNHYKNESTEWLFQELLWREYFKFLALNLKDKLFNINGINMIDKKWNRDLNIFFKWKIGQLGQDFIDANMRELFKTGWMSNRGRQNVASYFAKHLELDWTLGAQYFEEQLIDYDTESNWCNWQYVAGVGTDPRDRKFDPLKQSEMYDPNCDYRKQWLK